VTLKESDKHVNEWKNRRAKKAVEGLNKREFNAKYIPTLQEAIEEIFSLIPAGSKVGVGGSVTIRESGIIEKLKNRGDTIFDHWKATSKEERISLAKAQQDSDVFLTSTNSLTLKGQMVNLDGTGNRVSAMAFGPKTVIVLTGMNKVVDDLESALDRVKNYASPINYLRIDRKPEPPCRDKGYCTECLPPTRQCRVFSILEAKPKGFDSYYVFVVGEELGF